MIEFPFTFHMRVCVPCGTLIPMCVALGRGQPNRALIKGTVLVPSRRDLPGAVIPGTIERGSPQWLSRSELEAGR